MCHNTNHCHTPKKDTPIPKMHTPNLVDNNIDRICQLFPHCISEKAKTDASGNIIKDKKGHPIIE
ncbi:hypothetical protein [Moraxella lincolnii]|uniref:hypothetical protein n=1 Tax=Lwoffella lincolnii TaxID=90241 RepID=UPI00117BFD25|nr:hypothetical protein [Moraxella lincolnii]